MEKALLFSVADKILSFKEKADVIDDLIDVVRGELKGRIGAWKTITPDEIREQLGGDLLVALKAQLPQELQFLLVPVGELDDHLINVGDWSKEDATAAAPVKVAASAAGSIELDGILDDDLRTVLTTPVPAGSALFTVTLGGRIGIDVKGTNGTPLVSLAAAATASNEQALTVGYLRSADQPVLLEMLRLSDYFVHVADLHAVMQLFADKSARLIQHHYTGSHSLQLKVTLGSQLAAALGEIVADPDLAPAGEAEMSFSVRVRRSDDFTLTIERDSASSASVRLERRRRRERARVFKIGLTIEIKGLKKQIVERIGQLIPEKPEVKAALEKLDLLGKEVEDVDLREAVAQELADRFDGHAELFRKLLGNTSLEDAKKAVLEELQETLVDRITETVNLLTDDTHSAASRLANDIAAAIGSDEPALRDFLSSSAMAAMDRLREKLIETIESLEPTTAQEILEPLKGVSKTVDHAFGGAGKKLVDSRSRITAAVKEVYTKYTEFRQNLFELINERVAEQTAFSFIAERTEATNETTLLAFRILDAEAEGVADLYSAIWSRRLDDAWDLIGKAGASIAEVSGTYLTVFENQRRSLFTIDLFGLRAKTEALFSDEIAVGIDHTGKLVVAKSKAELRTIRHRGSESQTLNGEWLLDFMASDVSLVPPIKISVDVGDRSFGKDDLHEFFSSLDKLECVPPDAFDEVGAELLGGVDSSKRLADVTLSLVVALGWNDFSAILGADRDGRPREDKWNGAEVGEQLFRIVKRGHRFEDHFEKLERFASVVGLDPFALLLELGHPAMSRFKDQGSLDKYRAIGRSIVLFTEHLAKLQERWLELVSEHWTKELRPANTVELRAMIGKVDAELRSVLVAMFFSRTFAAFPRMSDVWQAACGARLLLDRAGRDHLLLTIEGPNITRRIIA